MKGRSHQKTKLAVSLLRVSTDRQFQEGESIENQRRKTEFVARREGLDIVRFFTEHYSGRKTDRRVLDELFEFLRLQKDIEVVLVGDIDRFTRGGSEIYLRLKRELSDLGVSLIDTTGIIQPERNRLEHLGVEYEWAKESPSRYAEVFMAEKARAEASDILTRTIGQQIQLAREGYQCRGALFGYKNLKVTTPDGKKKTTMIPHEIEGPWVRKMFELRADGGWSDDAIVDAINRMGFGSRPQNIYCKVTRRVLGQTTPKALTIKQLQRYIAKPLYAGIRNEAWNDEPVKAAIEPLVSIELFNQANRGVVVIEEKRDNDGKIRIKLIKGKKDYQSHKDCGEFLLRHVVQCSICHSPLVASKSRGKRGNYYGYYHCSRGHKYYGVSAKKFEETVGNYLRTLKAKPGFLDLFREIVRDVWMAKNRDMEERHKGINAHLTQLHQRQESLLSILVATTSPNVRHQLEQQLDELHLTIEQTQTELENTLPTSAQIDTFFERAKKRMEHPEEILEIAQTKHQLCKSWSAIFCTNPTYAQIEDGTPELTLIYRLNKGFPDNENLLAGELSANWNSFEKQIKQEQSL